MTSQDLRFAKFAVLLNAAVPGALLLWDAMNGNVGANPVNYAILTTGMLALIFLTLSLVVTPLRQITGFNQLFHFRRLLGLYAFFYALAHFSIFFIYDRDMSVSDTLSEMVKRKYLIVGSIGLLSIVPLAATSMNAMIRRMGPKNWQRLHRLAYVAAIAGVVHFYMQVKSDIRKPVAFAVALSVLLGYRVVMALVKWKARTHDPQSPRGFPVEAAPDSARWTGQLRVEKIIQETPDVRTFRLAHASGGQLPFAYQPGQYLTFTLAVDGKPVRRNYTIASAPIHPNHCEVTIKRDPQGTASRHMHDAVKEGDWLAVAAPAGKFTFTGDAARSVALIAGGVGITPLMSMLRYLAQRRWEGQVYLLYANKTEQDIIFRQEIATLRPALPNLHVMLTLTRPGPGWSGATGRIDAALLQRAIPDLAGTGFYICGPAEMLRATQELLGQLGVEASQVHTESFGVKPSASGNGTHNITFARSGKSAPLAGNRPILELAEELGVPVPSECRAGICGTCKCQMVSGSVQMDTQEALTPADRQNGIILLCQARALEDVVVEA